MASKQTAPVSGAGVNHSATSKREFPPETLKSMSPLMGRGCIKRKENDLSIRIEAWGDYACFTRPEFKAERVSYDVMTPSAARGLIESVYWHPGMRYIIDRIYVLNPVKFMSLKRNEVKSVMSVDQIAELAKKGKEIAQYTGYDIMQRTSLILKDVHYVIDCHFVMTDKATPSDNPGKFQDILRRRLAKGQCYRTPCFGCSEFDANVREWPGGDIPALPLTQDLGFMLYDFNYKDPSDAKPEFFRAKLENGCMDCHNPEVHS